MSAALRRLRAEASGASRAGRQDVVSEDGLRRIEERTRSIVDHVIDGIITIDEHGTIATFNLAAERIFGYASVEVIGRNVKILMPEPHRASHDEYVSGYLRTGQKKIIGIGRKLTGMRKDGTEFPMELAISEFRLGHVRNFTGIVRDITDRELAERSLLESEERFRAIAEQADAGIVLLDREGHVTFANEQFCQMTGRSRETILARHAATLVHPDDWDRYGPLRARLTEAGQSYSAEKRYIRPDGSYIWVRNAVSARRDARGQIVGSVGVLIDLTDRVRAEEALREADRTKDEFLSMLAHELRNPLAPIRTAFALFDREQLSPRGRQALTISQRQMRQLTRLVDDLLEVSRVTRGLIELRREAITVQEVVRQAVESFAPLVHERRQRIALELADDPVKLEADPVRLTQIIGNLLSNAIKYTDTGGDIVVRLHRADDTAVVEVQDTGIGIAPEHLPHVFGLFKQIDTSIDRSLGGLGIGLALAKQLVEMHGGKIYVRSSGLGQGAIFGFTLPCRESAAEELSVTAPLRG
jgi:PAS domain S-box-containing protein